MSFLVQSLLAAVNIGIYAAKGGWYSLAVGIFCALMALEALVNGS